MKSTVQVFPLSNNGDNRGNSFSIPPHVISFVGRVGDIHVTTIAPGAIRGNHYHLRRREALIVLYGGRWTLYWDEGEDSSPLSREFAGVGAAAVLIEPCNSHAVVNSRDSNLVVIGVSSEPYDPAETKPRDVLTKRVTS
jgi:dTDP-4-dehydrorhamnose 3,5-epimerase-like enzyme